MISAVTRRQPSGAVEADVEGLGGLLSRELRALAATTASLRSSDIQRSLSSFDL